MEKHSIDSYVLKPPQQPAPSTEGIKTQGTEALNAATGSVRWRRLLFLAVLVALSLRMLAVGFLYQDQLNPRRGHWPFGYETGRIARSIALGEGFANPLFQKTGPTAWMTPLYPYLVAAVFKLFGIYSSASAVILLSLNSLFSALTCVPVFFMARGSFGPKVAMGAAWAWAVFPYAIYLSADLIWETCLTTLLFTVLFWMTLELQRPNLATRLIVWAGFGLLWGITALANPSVLALLPFLVGWICYRLHRIGQSWIQQAAVALMALAIVCAPWFLRNYQTFHQFIPFRDNFWLEMHVGNNGDTSHWAPDAAHPSTSASEEEQYNRLGELDYMAAKRREVTSFIRGRPFFFVGMILRRIVFTWTGYWSFARQYLADEPMDPPNIVLSTALTVLALFGLRRAFQAGNPTAVPYLFVLVVIPVIYYITTSQMPYRHRIDPQILVLATYGATEKFSAWRWRNLNLAGH
ncbi:MAG TPA: hypothetical protein VOA41_10950 [Candidatus Dormibacteraeota bacterium]|nr:hypothetical protein [Candidatus Dormibacteraeota bacterium]